LSLGLPAAAATAADEAGGSAKLSLFANIPEPEPIADFEITRGPELPQLVRNAAATASAMRERDLEIMQKGIISAVSRAKRDAPSIEAFPSQGKLKKPDLPNLHCKPVQVQRVVGLLLA
jgi:hypothetical protein